MIGNFVGAFDNIYNQCVDGRLPKQTFVSVALNYYRIIKMP